MHVVAIGGSDAGISAALRARELDPDVEVTVVVADAYPNFSICGIPYYISGEVTHWRNLAHRTYADLEATGMHLRLDTLVTGIDVAGHRLRLRNPNGSEETLAYDRLVVGTGALPVRPPIGGLDGPDALGPADGVHLLHSMGDTFALERSLEDQDPATALIVGAGYVGLEMADGLTLRGLQVAQVEMLPEVLPTVDPELGGLVRAELAAHGVDVTTSATVTRISRAPAGAAGRLQVDGTASDGQPYQRQVDLVLVSVGVRPDTDLLVAAGAQTGRAGRHRGGRAHAHRPARHLRGRRLRGHPSPTPGRHLPAPGHHRPQAGPGGRRERRRRPSPLRRQPGHPGSQGVRPGRGPHRGARARSGPGRVHPGHQPEQPRRPQGVLPHAPTPSPSVLPAIPAPAGCWAPSWWAGWAPRSPNESISTPPPSTTT